MFLLYVLYKTENTNRVPRITHRGDGKYRRFLPQPSCFDYAIPRRQNNPRFITDVASEKQRGQWEISSTDVYRYGRHSRFRSAY